MENKFIAEAMNRCFGEIQKNFSDRFAITGTLLLFLASGVYHSDSILDVVSKRPGHSFGTIPIFADAKLLDKLKKLLTLKPSGSVTQASGIPNHVKKRHELAQVTMKLDLVARNMKNLVDMVKEAVKTAIDDKIAESGQITAPRVLEIMDEKFKAYQVHVNQGLVDALK